MRRVVVFSLMQAYALLLAMLRHADGMHTDEAKYLLNIPYPHPPLGRGILHALEWLPAQELVWRIVLASILVHGGWLLYHALNDALPSVRWSAVGCWCFSAAILLQAGSIMMAPLTALQALVLCALLVRPTGLRSSMQPWIGLWWLVSLFTAYQAVLFAPVAFAALGRAHARFAARIAYVGVPILLVGLYTLSNPLVPASLLVHGGSLSFMHKLQGTLLLLGIGGSVVLVVTGILGSVLARSAAILASLLLVFCYLLLGPHTYYAILFTPLLAAGTALLLRRFPRIAVFALGATLCTGLCIAFLRQAEPPVLAARDVLRQVDRFTVSGSVLIAGAFGHEWQYASVTPVQRFQLGLVPHARAIICLETCVGWEPDASWQRLQGMSVEAWVRMGDQRMP